MSIDVAKMIQKAGENTGRFGKHKVPIRKVRCQGCGKEICSDEDLGAVDYVKTKRGTDIFFHRACVDKVWKRKIV